MISDNGSTYLSAAEELHSLMESRIFKEELGRKHVSWRFIIKKGWGVLGAIDWTLQVCNQERRYWEGDMSLYRPYRLSL